MDNIWDGITQSKTLDPKFAQIRHELANAAKSYDWTRTIEILSEHPQLANSSRPDGKSFFTPLHQAAYGGASAEIVKRIVEFGAWRTLQNAGGEKPIDIAIKREHRHLISILTPEYKHHTSSGVLPKIQQYFHQVIRGRANHLVEEHALRLPELEPLLELEQAKMWFAVPGMYGGFSYRLETEGEESRLISESWCRVVGGSGERHEINAFGSRLVDEGFV